VAILAICPNATCRFWMKPVDGERVLFLLSGVRGWFEVAVTVELSAAARAWAWAPDEKRIPAVSKSEQEQTPARYWLNSHNHPRGCGMIDESSNGQQVTLAQLAGGDLAVAQRPSPRKAVRKILRPVSWLGVRTPTRLPAKAAA
jgi:hypothetical protein